MNPKRPNKPYHHGDLKNALLEAGEDLLQKRGATGLSLRETAQKAGVSHGAPYRHFRDKRALLAGIARVGFERLTRAIEEAVRKFPDSPKEQLSQAGLAYVRLATRYPHTLALMFGGLIEGADLDEEYRKVAESAADGLRAIVERGQEWGVFRQGDPSEMAFAAWSLVHGLSTLINSSQFPDTHNDKSDPTNLTVETLNLFFEGFCRKEKSAPDPR